jgi:MFS family permease
VFSWLADNRHRSLLLIAVGNFAQFGVRLLLGAVVPLILVTFDASKSSVGLALTGMWAVYALSQFPSGILADRFGERPLLIAGLGGTVLGAALVAVSPSILLFGLFTVLLGAGTGLFFSPASSLVSRLYERRGGPLGALTASGAIAGVVYPAIGSVVGARIGWRVAIGLGALLPLPILLATVGLVPVRPPLNPRRRLGAIVERKRIAGVLTRPSVAYTTVVAVMMGFTFQSITSFFPTFLVEYRGIEPGLAGIGFGIVFGLSSLAQPAAGKLSDAVSRDVAIGSSVALTATGIAVLLVVAGPVGLVVGAGLLGVGVSWPGTIQARFMDQLNDEERGYGFGLVRTVYMFLGASGSAVVGGLADSYGWLASYGLVVGLLGTVLALLAINRLFGLDL